MFVRSCDKAVHVTSVSRTRDVDLSGTFSFCFAFSRPLPSSFPSLSPQTPDAKKEEFRKYLEKAGVVDALTKVLVGLYEEPERPLHAVEYVKKYMGAPVGVDVDALRAENERLRAEVASLKEQLHAANAAAGH